MEDNMEEQIDYGEEDYIEEEEEEAVDAEEMMKRMAEMDKEIQQTDSNNHKVNQQLMTINDQIDEKSIYVGQVEYSASPEELQAHFAPCGEVSRVTIVCDKITGQSKGFAYVEFTAKEAMENALKLDDSTFKGRQLKVYPKRQNIPMAGRGGRGRGGRGFPGRGRGGRGGYFAGGPAGGRFAPGGRGGGRFPGRFAGRFPGGGRGRGRGNYYYNPY